MPDTLNTTLVRDEQALGEGCKVQSLGEAASMKSVQYSAPSVSIITWL